MKLTKRQAINKNNIINRCIKEGIDNIINISIMLFEYKSLLTLSESELAELATDIQQEVLLINVYDSEVY